MGIMAKRNTFTKAAGSTYKCDTCGRGTRNTGDQPIGSRLCPQCYELAGIENEISDGYRTQADAQPQIDNLMAAIRAKGGNPDAEFASLLPKPAAAVAPAPLYTVELVMLDPTPELLVVAKANTDPNLSVDDAGKVHAMLRNMTLPVMLELFRAFPTNHGMPVRMHLRAA
jgi:hypothetical protein